LYVGDPTLSSRVPAWSQPGYARACGSPEASFFDHLQRPIEPGKGPLAPHKSQGHVDRRRDGPPGDGNPERLSEFAHVYLVRGRASLDLPADALLRPLRQRLQPSPQVSERGKDRRPQVLFRGRGIHFDEILVTPAAAFGHLQQRFGTLPEAVG